MKNKIITIWLLACIAIILVVSRDTGFAPDTTSKAAIPADSTTAQTTASKPEQKPVTEKQSTVPAITNPEEPIETSKISQSNPATTVSEQTRAVGAVPAPSKAVASINVTGLGNFPVEVIDGDVALVVIRRASGKYGFALKTESFGGLGEMVVQLGDRYGGPPDWTHWWEFYYNGQSSNIGVSAQAVKAGDIIGWEYR